MNEEWYNDRIRIAQDRDWVCRALKTHYYVHLLSELIAET